MWLLWLIMEMTFGVVASLLASLVASRFKHARLTDACFRCAWICGWPITLALHLGSGYYGLAPAWLEPAFHEWRVARYFTPSDGGPHTRDRLKEQAQSGRSYARLALPMCGKVVRWDFRDAETRASAAAAALDPVGVGASATARRVNRGPLRVVSWNLEFGYLLQDLIKELKRLQPDVVCLQEVDVHSDATRRVRF